MKQKDVALIVVVVIFSAIISLVLSKLLFEGPKNTHQKAEVVEAIDPTFPTPDPTYFNSNAIDPTQLIQIGSNNNSNPFNATSNP